MNKQAIELFSYMTTNCKYKDEALQFYFYKTAKDNNKLAKKERFLNLKTNFNIGNKQTTENIAYAGR